MAENRELALVLKLVADQFQSELKKSGGALGEFNKFVSDWKVQLTAVGTTLFAVAKSTANYGDELVKTSQRMGTTVEETARLQHAARLSDTDLQGLSTTIGFLSKNMLEASQGNAEARSTFQSLNISTVDVNGQLKGTTQILLEMNDRFRLMPEGPEKTALAMKAMGKSGKEVLPLLNSDLREAFAEADKLGLVMSEKDARAAEHFNDELTKLQASIRGVTNDIGTALIPKFDAIAHGLTTIITDARSATHALGDLLKLNGADQPSVGRLLPEGGGRGLRVVPLPSKEEQAKFTPEPSGFVQKTQDELGQAMVKRFISEEQIKASLRKQEEERGKALLEIYLANNRAIDIRNKLAAEDATVQERTYRHMLDFKDQEEQNEKDRQERLGKNIVQRTSLEVKIREDALAKERDGLAQNAQAWLDYQAQVGGSTQLRYDKEIELLTANLTKQLDLTTSETARLLVAWQEHDSQVADDILSKTTLTATQRETIELQALTKIAQANEKASDDVFAGWAAGLRRYVQDQQSMFGLGADMSRRFFQTMEQFSQRFFFDAMEGKINGTKQLFASLLDFAKQITSQIAGQLLTKQIGTALAGGTSGSTLLSALFSGSTLEGAYGASNAAARGAANPALYGPGFATGGQFVVGGNGGTDSTQVMFRGTPGEIVDIRTPGQAAGGVTVIVNNYGNQEVQTSSSRGSDGKQTIYVTVREIVKGLVQGGEMDAPMGRRFGVNPRPATR